MEEKLVISWGREVLIKPIVELIFESRGVHPIFYFMLIMYTYHARHINYVPRLSMSISFKIKNENFSLNCIVLKLFTKHRIKFLYLLHDYTTRYKRFKNYFKINFYLFFPFPLTFSPHSLFFLFFFPSPSPNSFSASSSYDL